MICTGCGHQIAMNKSACPNCHRNTNPDQQAYLLSFICFGILFAGGVFFEHAAWGAAAGVAAAFAVQIVHRHLQGRRIRPEEPMPPEAE